MVGIFDMLYANPLSASILAALLEEILTREFKEKYMKSIIKDGKEGYYKEIYNEVIEKFKERMEHLAYFKAPIPYGLFKKSPEGKIYLIESMNAYLLGLPNASILLAFRSLTVGIKIKYIEIEGKSPEKDDPYKLIEWAHSFLKDKKDIAHGFRILRNWIEHEEGTASEQDALEVLRHVSIILDILHPFEKTSKEIPCQYCGSKISLELYHDNIYFGKTLQVRCTNCKREFPIILFPNLE